MGSRSVPSGPPPRSVLGVSAHAPALPGVSPRSVFGVSSHRFLLLLGVAPRPGVIAPGVSCPGVTPPGREKKKTLVQWFMIACGYRCQKTLWRPDSTDRFKHRFSFVFVSFHYIFVSTLFLLVHFNRSVSIFEKSSFSQKRNIISW